MIFKGEAKDRPQTYNNKTDSWVKEASDIGTFIHDETSDDNPFKGLRL